VEKVEEPKSQREFTKKVSNLMGETILVKYLSKVMENQIKNDIPRAMIYLHPPPSPNSTAQSFSL